MILMLPKMVTRVSKSIVIIESDSVGGLDRGYPREASMYSMLYQGKDVISESVGLRMLAASP